jgi:aspartate aminotransferase
MGRSSQENKPAGFGAPEPCSQPFQIASTQTISGTGAFHIGALFLARSVLQASSRIAHIGLPTWGNYLPMLKLVGLDAAFYKHYDPAKGSVDFDSALQAVRSAPEGSPFILQACCHNPTSADFTKDQWHTLADEMEIRGHLPIFDIVYKGLGSGVDEDAYAVRYFEARGFEMLVCRSFSKNFALYGERCGALHVVCPSEEIATSVHDQLRFLVRSEFSSSPAFGARIVENVLSTLGKKDMW